MDDIKQRLQETSENCFKCYEAWAADKKTLKAREDLQEAVHELRKVASRLEIEIAVSERSDMSQKPIPIPHHRDARRRNVEEGNDMDDEDNSGNGNGNGNPGSSAHQGGVRRSSGPRRRSQGGGNES